MRASRAHFEPCLGVFTLIHSSLAALNTLEISTTEVGDTLADSECLNAATSPPMQEPEEEQSDSFDRMFWKGVRTSRTSLCRPSS